MVPPSQMVNKDFLKLVLADEKKLLPIAECRFINVPKFDELSVKNIYPLFAEDEEVMRYFPDAYPREKGPARDYFFTVLNTLRPEYVDRIVKHAHKVRYASDQVENQHCEIQMTTEWFEKLNEEPFISPKYPISSNICRL